MLNDGSLTTRNGSYITYLNKGKIDFINRWKIGNAEVIDGYWAIPKQKEIPRPLALPLMALLKYKECSGLQALLAKQMSVGVYGKLGEQRNGEKKTPYFNPCWFAEISNQTSIEVGNFIYEHRLQEHVIHISVDGILSDKEVIL